MRPNELTPLFASLQALTGIGPRLIVLLKKCLTLPPGVAQPRVLDLLWHLPNGVIDRRAEPTVAEAAPGSIATLKVRVLKHKVPPRGNTRAPYKVQTEDDSGRLDLVFFHAERKFIERQLPVGEERYVSGRVERYGETLQMSHPDYIVAPAQRDELPLLEPVYPLTAGLSGKIVQKASRQALERLGAVPEWQDAQWLKARGWPGFVEALQRLHRPTDAADLSPGDAAPPAAGLRRASGESARCSWSGRGFKAATGRAASQGDGKRRAARHRRRLPFALTDGQLTALRRDRGRHGQRPAACCGCCRAMSAPARPSWRCWRLLGAVEAGFQGALMAPTEMLVAPASGIPRALRRGGGCAHGGC